jgi:hypothetical protein
MSTISQRNTGSVWDKRARYIEQSTSALQRYVAMGDAMARFTKMKEYTPQQAQEADVSLYSRLLSDEQKTAPGKMPERSSGVAHTSETTGWGKRHLAISGVSHQPYVQTAHHSNAVQVGGTISHNPDIYNPLSQQGPPGPSGPPANYSSFDGFDVRRSTDPYTSPSPQATHAIRKGGRIRRQALVYSPSQGHIPVARGKHPYTHRLMT